MNTQRSPKRCPRPEWLRPRLVASGLYLQTLERLRTRALTLTNLLTRDHGQLTDEQCQIVINAWLTCGALMIGPSPAIGAIDLAALSGNRSAMLICAAKHSREPP